MDSQDPLVRFARELRTRKEALALPNVGSSCYANAVLQCVLQVPGLWPRLAASDEPHVRALVAAREGRDPRAALGALVRGFCDAQGARAGEMQDAFDFFLFLKRCMGEDIGRDFFDGRERARVTQTVN
jgi:hypothetical protein